jgi:hypothetical protein
MAMLRRFMLLLLRSDNGWSAISPENRDPLFRIALKTWNLRASGAQKGSPAKGPGIPYSLRRNIFRNRQKTMGWLRHFGTRRSICSAISAPLAGFREFRNANEV